MTQTKAIHEEIIDEISTQTLARFGLNIFSLNTYGAYSASVTATNIVSRTYEQHKNNPQYKGQTFEDLDVGQKNIIGELLNKGQKTYTTDELADIKKVADIIRNKKNIEELNVKDRAKYDFIMNNYKDEVDMIYSNKDMLNNAKKNHPHTDVVTFDKEGNIVQKSQHKVIKDTEGFFEKEKLYNKNGEIMKDENGNIMYKKNKNGEYVYKYLENNDIFTVPFDDYKKHKENLENMINDPERSESERKRAQKALDMLNKNNVTNRLMCENPKTTAVITQSIAASGHIVQAGLSDAIVVALSTLANGAIFEIKDAFSDSNDIKFIDRLKRLLKKVIEDFNKTYKRGASFGVLDVGVGILSQIFKSISAKISTIWKSIRTSAKSIFNAIYSFITGEIKDYKTLISTILKGIISASVVVGTVALETQLEIFLAPIVTPVVASFLAPALSIVIGSIAVVLSMRSIDLALNAIFGILAQRDISRLKAEKIRKICEDLLPELILEKEELRELIVNTYKDRTISFENSFKEFKAGLSQNDTQSIICGLIGINDMYGKKLQFVTFKDFDCFMQDKNQKLKL